MGPDRGAWHRLRQEQFQPMQQNKHTRERQIQPPIVKQCLQPAGSKPQLSGPTCQTKVKTTTDHFHTHIHSRKHKKLSNTVEGPDSGPMDPPSGRRLPDRFFISTPSRYLMSNVRDEQISTGSFGSRDFGILEQRSSRKGQIRKTRLCQHDVCSPLEGRQVETNYQSKIPLSVCGETSLQDGRHQKSEGYP